MSRQLETTLSEAAAKNLSAAATLEWLADMELEARQPPRHRTPLQMLAIAGAAQHRRLPLLSITRAGSQNKNRILRLLDLDVSRTRAPTWCSSEILGWARPSCPKSWAGAPARPISASCSPPPWTCSITCSPRRSITRWSASSRPIPSPRCSSVDELGYLALDQQTSNLFYQVISTRHSQKRSTIITTNTAVLRLGQHPLQHDHRHRHRRPARGELRDLPARAATACASPRIRIRRPSSCAGSDQAPRCGDNPCRRSPPG